jgi:hypothetical protein
VNVEEAEKKGAEEVHMIQFVNLGEKKFAPTQVFWLLFCTFVDVDVALSYLKSSLTFLGSFSCD